MCHDVVTILSCGCKHVEGVEFCHDAIFANEGQACPPEKRTPRRHIRWDSDPRDTRSCGKDPCPTQLAREHDEKLQQVRDEVAMQYARGERRPNGEPLGRPGVWDEFEAKAKAQSRGDIPMEEGQDMGKPNDKPVDLEGNDNDGYHYQHQGPYSAVPGGTADIASEGKGKEKATDDLGYGYQLVSSGPVSERPNMTRESSRYSPPPSAPIPIANPVTYPRKDSLDMGRDFDYEFDTDMVAIFGEGAGGLKWARAKTGPPCFVAGKTLRLAGEMNKQRVGSLIDRVDGYDLGEKQYGGNTDMRLTGPCDDEGSWLMHDKNTALDEVGASGQTITTTASTKGEDRAKTTGADKNEITDIKQRKKPERITIPSSSGRITPNLNNTPVTPSPTSSSKRSSRFQPWPSSSHTNVTKERESPRKSWVTKVINSGAPNLVTSPTFSTPEGLFSGGSPGSPRTPGSQQSSGFADLAVGMTVPSPVFAKPGREGEGQGHGLIVKDDTVNPEIPTTPHGIAISAKTGCTPSPITTPSKAVVRGVVRHVSTPIFKAPTRPGRSSEASTAESPSVGRVTTGVNKEVDTPSSDN